MCLWISTIIFLGWNHCKWLFGDVEDLSIQVTSVFAEDSEDQWNTLCSCHICDDVDDLAATCYLYPMGYLIIVGMFVSKPTVASTASLGKMRSGFFSLVWICSNYEHILYSKFFGYNDFFCHLFRRQEKQGIAAESQSRMYRIKNDLRKTHVHHPQNGLARSILIAEEGTCFASLKRTLLNGWTASEVVVCLA